MITAERFVFVLSCRLRKGGNVLKQIVFPTGDKHRLCLALEAHSDSGSIVDCRFSLKKVYRPLVLLSRKKIFLYQVDMR